jgi:hypothetical protein
MQLVCSVASGHLLANSIETSRASVERGPDGHSGAHRVAGHFGRFETGPRRGSFQNGSPRVRVQPPERTHARGGRRRGRPVRPKSLQEQASLRAPGRFAHALPFEWPPGGRAPSSPPGQAAIIWRITATSRGSFDFWPVPNLRRIPWSISLTLTGKCRVGDS